MATSKSRERVARNFVKRYGEKQFTRLIQLLQDGESGQVIADQFGVSRERVRQWKNTFGQSYSLYQVHPDIERILRDSEA